jgi:hypothetical protein
MAETNPPLTRGPDKTTDVPTLWLALGVTVFVAVFLGIWGSAKVAGTLGDTDDALRLVLVRDLLSGRAGWWDQHFTRLQPPLGMDLHWSRLIDGSLALLEAGFRLFLGPAQAELATRITWPLLWLFPPITAALVIARKMRGPMAAQLGAVLLVVNLLLYVQWKPGRIDHHNVQIALCMVALAGAVAGGRRGPLIAGVVTGLALAVGLEALVFEAVIGAAIALAWVVDPQQRGDGAKAYAGGLLATFPLLFLIQTPPQRWTHSYCDTAGFNLALAATLAGVGLLAAVLLTTRRSPAVRILTLGATGLVALATYVALEPACLHGPLGQMDPRLVPIWLIYIQEMQSLFRHFPDPSNGFALGQVIFHGVAVVCWLWLGRRASGRTFAWGLMGACLLLGVAVESQAQRLSFYTAWFATPLVAAAVAEFGELRLRARLLPMVALVVAVSPGWVTSTADRLHNTSGSWASNSAQATCQSPAAYRALAGLPPGLVLGEIDLGPYVLATTQDSVVAAPYHRLATGMLEAEAALTSGPGLDEIAVRRLKVDYVITCPAHRIYAKRVAMAPQSLQRRLDHDDPPAWLVPLWHNGGPLQVYRVKPAEAG